MPACNRRYVRQVEIALRNYDLYYTRVIPCNREPAGRRVRTCIKHRGSPDLPRSTAAYTECRRERRKNGYVFPLFPREMGNAAERQRGKVSPLLLPLSAACTPDLQTEKYD